MDNKEESIFTIGPVAYNLTCSKFFCSVSYFSTEESCDYVDYLTCSNFCELGPRACERKFSPSIKGVKI